MAEKLTKQNIIDKIAVHSGLDKKSAGKALDGFVATVKEALADGDSVSLIGFGTFEVRQKAARKGRNPRTGDVIDIPAKKVPAFRAGKRLKDSVS